MSKRRIAIIFTVIGFVIISVITFILDIGVRHSDFEQTGKVNKICSHSIDPDIIIFGSSVSEVGINSSILSNNIGISVYNCSLNGTRYMQYKGLIEEFNTYSKNNKYVVLVETYFSFEQGNALAYAERYLSRLDDKYLYNDLYDLQPDLVWKCKYVPFYKYIALSKDYYKNSVIGWKNILLKNVKNDDDLGFYPVDRNWEADADEAIKNTTAFEIKIDSSIVYNYINSIKNLQKNGKKVIIVLTPMYFKILNTKTDFTPLRKELTKIAQITGVRFLDFSNCDISNNKNNYYNTNHLNYKGANIFSSVLSDSLNIIIKKTTH